MDPSEQQAIFVYYENDRRKFKMLMKGDISKLPVDKVKRYLTNATGVPQPQQELSFDGQLLHDHWLGEDFGLTPNATLTLSVRNPPTEPMHDAVPPQPRFSVPASNEQRVAPVRAPPQQPQPPTPTQQPLHADPLPGRSPGVGPAGAVQSPGPSSFTQHHYESPGVSAPSRYGDTSMSHHATPAAASNAPSTSGMLSRNTALEEENAKLRMELAELRKNEDHLRRSGRPSDNVLANAKANLVELGNELGMALSFDSNLTCVVGADERNTLLITFDAATERLYLYSTLLTYLPEDAAMRLRLYEILLEGSLLGRDMAGGGCGVSLQSGIVMMSTTVDLKHSDAFALRDTTPKFVEALVRWRKTITDSLSSGLSAPSVGSIPAPAGGSRHADDSRYGQPSPAPMMGYRH